MFRNAHVAMKYALFKSYRMDLYGSLFWVLGSGKVDKFYTIWRKCPRRLIGVPLKTHSKHISLIVKDLSVEYQLYLRLNKFLWKLNQSNNTSVQLYNTLMQNGSN